PPRAAGAHRVEGGRPGACAALLLGRDRTAHARRLSRGGGVSDVDAVVISHGEDPDLGACLTSLAPQVGKLVVISNLPGYPAPLPDGATHIVNPRPLGFSANANRGIRETTAPFVLVANPDT